MEIRSYNNFDRKANSLDSGLFCADESRTVQESKEESDINTIVRQFGVTGKLPEGVVAPMYGDFSDIEDYRSALEVIEAAEAAFAEMPATVRARFLNDPQQFVDFCSDERNREEMTALGLIVAPPKQPSE